MESTARRSGLYLDANQVLTAVAVRPRHAIAHLLRHVRQVLAIDRKHRFPQTDIGFFVSLNDHLAIVAGDLKWRQRADELASFLRVERLG